jgi:hypothetical protein
MQVQYAIDRQFNRVVHIERINSGSGRGQR